MKKNCDVTATGSTCLEDVSTNEMKKTETKTETLGRYTWVHIAPSLYCC